MTYARAVDANQSILIAAFRRMGKRHHPDRAVPSKRDAATRKFKEITAAYHWLEQRMKKAA